MLQSAKSTFTVTSWEEQPFEGETAGAKITQALVSKSYEGNLTGLGSVIYIMKHQDDGTANFIGLQQINGSLLDKQGSFAIEQTGFFDGKEAKGTFIVKQGSGTGDLASLTGKGEFSSPLGQVGTFTFEFDL